MPKPLFPLCQPRFIISFERSIGLPWWSSAENLPANAGDTGLIPAPGELHSWTCVPHPLSGGPWSLCSATREATRMRSPHTATRVAPPALHN